MNSLHVAERGAVYALEAAVAPIADDAFELMATAPQGVAKLRELILSLATQGKLVAQSESDEPASALLPKFAAIQRRMVASGVIRPTSRAADNEHLEQLSDLPAGWVATTLSTVAWPQAGFAFKSAGFNDNHDGTPLIRIRDVGANAPRTFFSGEFRDEFLVHEGDWLIGMDGDFRVAQWSGPDALLNQRVTRLQFFGDIAQPMYVCIALQQALRQLQGTKAYTTVDHLSGKQIASRVIPLPPAAEQRRIVARVEELRGLCDELETRGRLQDEQHARLVATLFGALAASTSPAELADNWQRIARHFDLLLDRPEAVDALEQTILQLAVRGLLVPQDPADEPARALLARSSEEYVSDTRELPALPSGWEWATIGAIASVGTGTTPSRTNPAYFSPASIPWVTSGETGRPFIDSTEQGVSRLALRDTSLKVYPSGTLIVAMYGQGKTRGQVTELRIDATTNQACAAVVPTVTDAAHRRYLKLFFEKIYDEIRELSAGGAQPNLNVGKVKATLVPLPPLAEQHRIVARVEELRALCAGLRQRLQQSRATQSNLAEALVARAAA